MTTMNHTEGKQYEAAALTGEEFTVSQTVDPEQLRALLVSLVQEDCVHSWRNFPAEGSAEELLHWENARRPTKLFFFHMSRGSQTRMVAAGAVAERIHHDFPHAGFPVLGRCCIMPEFRSQGFYRRILQYRIEYCRTQFGNDLKAIHIGAVNDRIRRVIANHRLDGWPNFIHMGDEELSIGGGIRKVGAYLLLMPQYIRRMQDALAGCGAPDSVAALRDVLECSQPDEVRNMGTLMKKAFEQARQVGWFGKRECREIEETLNFCHYVPLVGFRNDRIEK